MKKSKVLILSFLIVSLTGIFLADFSQAQENYICAVYITGIGCSNCAVTDPMVLSEWTKEHPNLVVIEYEIYKNHEENYPPADEYFKNYIPEGVRPGIPLLILNKDNVFLGRFEVLGAEEKIIKLNENACPSPDGSSQKFENLDINNLPGKPNIWANGRILMPAGERKVENDLLRKLLFEKKISLVLEEVDFECVDCQVVPISRGEVNFDNALLVDGWRFQWNGEGLNIGQAPVAATSETVKDNQESSFKYLYLLIPIAVFVSVFIILYFKRRKHELTQ